MDDTASLTDSLAKVATLDSLLDWLEDNREAILATGFNPSSMPRFGGEPPPVVSWDATRLLIGDITDGFEIVDRPDVP
jgi:hypothetical protein